MFQVSDCLLFLTRDSFSGTLRRCFTALWVLLRVRRRRARSRCFGPPRRAGTPGRVTESLAGPEVTSCACLKTNSDSNLDDSERTNYLIGALAGWVASAGQFRRRQQLRPTVNKPGPDPHRHGDSLRPPALGQFRVNHKTDEK